MRKLKLEELNRLSIDEFKSTKKNEIIVVLDNIRSLYNVGSILRSCDAFLVKKVYLCGITPHPPHREIRKTAIGAEESVDWEAVADIGALIHNLKAAGNVIVSIEQTDQSIPLRDFQKTDATYVLVFGNEVDGVSLNVIEQTDHAVEILQYGTKHSLNVSVAAGLVLFHFSK